ncbi:MAG TPA: Coenzyme F420 hydrogenase/dehydrogenase, beta subunit C-terminal domain [Desulfobacterales bacterium]
MAKVAKYEIREGGILDAFKELFAAVLQLDDVVAVLVPQQLPGKKTVMPTLVSDAGALEGLNPLAPAFPMNAAKIVSRLSRKPLEGKLAVLLRPCEVRAFVELVKLKQGRFEDLIVLSCDCLGAYRNTDFMRICGDNIAETSLQFFRNALAGEIEIEDGVDIAPACRACEHPVAQAADITIGFVGVDPEQAFLLIGQSERGDELLERLDLDSGQMPAEREEALKVLVEKRTAARDAMVADTRAAVESLEKLTEYLAGCVNCYNCRVACPVCYCKECVFVTDVFNHLPSQYLQWARRKKMIKMPTDTVFYHLTRLAHMSTACVGCGQCSNACPNEIPVMELFRTIAGRTQKAFEYEAGRDVEDKPPLSEFREKEFSDVVGIQAN